MELTLCGSWCQGLSPSPHSCIQRPLVGFLKISRLWIVQSLFWFFCCSCLFKVNFISGCGFGASLLLAAPWKYFGNSEFVLKGGFFLFPSVTQSSTEGRWLSAPYSLSSFSAAGPGSVSAPISATMCCPSHKFEEMAGSMQPSCSQCLSEGAVGRKVPESRVKKASSRTAGCVSGAPGSVKRGSLTYQTWERAMGPALCTIVEGPARSLWTGKVNLSSHYPQGQEETPSSWVSRHTSAWLFFSLYPDSVSKTSKYHILYSVKCKPPEVTVSKVFPFSTARNFLPLSFFEADWLVFHSGGASRVGLHRAYSQPCGWHHKRVLPTCHLPACGWVSLPAVNKTVFTNQDTCKRQML